MSTPIKWPQGVLEADFVRASKMRCTKFALAAFLIGPILRTFIFSLPSAIYMFFTPHISDHAARVIFSICFMLALGTNVIYAVVLRRSLSATETVGDATARDGGV
jgi:hypothetical protein